MVEKESYSKTCPFCKGNEHMCGESLDEIIVDGEWKARSVFNKFPILDMSTDEIFGQHEVVVESDKHNANYLTMIGKPLGKYPFKHIGKVLNMLIVPVRYCQVRLLDYP